MAELLKRVLHHLEGEEVTQHEAWFSGDDKPRTVTVKTCGTERWIRRVHERQVLTAFDAIALIHLALVNYLDFPSEEQEQALVEGWALELIKSAQTKEVIARDPFTLLPFGGDLESLEWGLSMTDADSFVTARAMKWTFSGLAQRVHDEEFGTPANQLLKAVDAQTNIVENNQEVVSNSSATFGTTKRWTPEVVEELIAYHAVHGTKKAAEKYRVNEPRIREVIRNNKPQPTANNPFVHKKQSSKTNRAKR